MPCSSLSFSSSIILPPLLLLPSPPQCSVSCGRGTKQREIACVYQNQTKIEEEHCSHLPRPQTQKACRARGCPSWKANRWREVCLLFSPFPGKKKPSPVAPRGRKTHTGGCVGRWQLTRGHKHSPEDADVGRVHTEHLSNHRSVYSCRTAVCHFLECELNTAGWVCGALDI